MPMQKSAWAEITERLVSSPDEFPKQRSPAVAKEIAFRGYDAILDLVIRLPKNVAAECNPSNPQMAFAVLESECTGILCDAYEVYAAWSKVGPHGAADAMTAPRFHRPELFNPNRGAEPFATTKRTAPVGL
jgi:hypothetical protein